MLQRIDGQKVKKKNVYIYVYIKILNTPHSRFFNALG